MITLEEQLRILKKVAYAAQAWRSTYGCSNEYNERLMDALDLLDKSGISTETDNEEDTFASTGFLKGGSLD